MMSVLVEATIMSMSITVIDNVGGNMVQMVEVLRMMMVVIVMSMTVIIVVVVMILMTAILMVVVMIGIVLITMMGLTLLKVMDMVEGHSPTPSHSIVLLMKNGLKARIMKRL